MLDNYYWLWLTRIWTHVRALSRRAYPSDVPIAEKKSSNLLKQPCTPPPSDHPLPSTLYNSRLLSGRTRQISSSRVHKWGATHLGLMPPKASNILDLLHWATGAPGWLGGHIGLTVSWRIYINGTRPVPIESTLWKASQCKQLVPMGRWGASALK